MNMDKTKVEKSLASLKKKLELNEKKLSELKIQNAQMSKRAAELEKFVKAYDDLEKKYLEQFPDDKPKARKKNNPKPETEKEELDHFLPTFVPQPSEEIEEEKSDSSPDFLKYFNIIPNTSDQNR